MTHAFCALNILKSALYSTRPQYEHTHTHVTKNMSSEIPFFCLLFYFFLFQTMTPPPLQKNVT